MPSTDFPITPTLLATPHRFLYHTPSRTAILADLHLGIETQLLAAGISMPDITLAPIRTAWQNLLDRNPARLILAGDIFDSPTPDPQARASASKLLAQLPKHCRITFLPGNHDPDPATLREILTTHPLEITDSTTLDNFLITHGHQINWQSEIGNRQSPPILIVGHQHPSLFLATRVQSAKMFCYALCKTQTLAGKSLTLVLLPPFSHAPIGSSLANPHNWILDCLRPTSDNIRILGIIPSSTDSPSPRVLDFGPLSLLDNSS